MLLVRRWLFPRCPLWFRSYARCACRFRVRCLLPTVLPTLFDYEFNDVEAKWIPWEQQVRPFAPPVDGSFHKILVPTVDTVRSTRLD